MQTLNISETLNDIKTYAANPLGETRVIDSIAVGQHVRQGDVYLELIDSFDKKEYVVTQDRQLAKGNTKGSRHTVDESVTVYAPKSNNTNAQSTNGGWRVMGPVVVSKDRFTLSHPQHACFSLPGGTYQVSYQVDPNTLQAVLD